MPNIDFTTLQLNVAPTDTAKYFMRTDGDTLYYEVTLVRKPMYCPLCDSKMIGHGQKQKKISHPVVRDWNGVILYHANHYLYKSCGKTALEKNSFTFSWDRSLSFCCKVS